MKICMIAPGELPIPPKGWGGVEALIWNYKGELENQGHEVVITNTKDLRSVIQAVNAWKPDFVHLQYDVYADIMPYIQAPVKAMTSHYPYLDYPDMRKDYEWIFHKFCQNHSYIFTLSELNNFHFKSFGAREDLLWAWTYGVNSENFNFNLNPSLPERTLCLGKVEPRKQQAYLQTLNANIDFAGPVVDNKFNQTDSSCLGMWSRDQVYNELTEYANLILFSDGEAAPQVTAEALLAGCGLVVSKEASANLDESLPFVDVVDRTTIDSETLIKTIEKNRINSIKHRKEIRKYGLETFDLKDCVSRYIEKIEELRNKNVGI